MLGAVFAGADNVCLTQPRHYPPSTQLMDDLPPPLVDLQELRNCSSYDHPESSLHSQSARRVLEYELNAIRQDLGRHVNSTMSPGRAVHRGAAIRRIMEEHGRAAQGGMALQEALEEHGERTLQDHQDYQRRVAASERSPGGISNECRSVRRGGEEWAEEGVGERCNTRALHTRTHTHTRAHTTQSHKRWIQSN